MAKDNICDVCEKPSKNGLHKKCKVRIEKALKECNEGRTYTMSCRHYKGKGFFVCSDCVVEDCKKWYKLGGKDERKRLKNVSEIRGHKRKD